MYSAQFVTRYRFFGNLWRRAALNLCGIQVSRSEVEHLITRTTCVRATTSHSPPPARIVAGASRSANAELVAPHPSIVPFFAGYPRDAESVYPFRSATLGS